MNTNILAKGTIISVAGWSTASISQKDLRAERDEMWMDENLVHPELGWTCITAGLLRTILSLSELEAANKAATLDRFV